MGRKEKIVSQENTIGARMRRARMQKGITLSDMAKTIGYTKGRLSTVENSYGRPSRELVTAYEQVLGLEPGVLVADERKNSGPLGRRYSSLSTPVLEDVQPREALAYQKTDEVLVESAALHITPVRASNQKLQEYVTEAPRIGSFYGRAPELAQLQTWIVQEHCRLITILGIGGVGKTLLASVLKELVKGEFDFVYWR